MIFVHFWSHVSRAGNILLMFPLLVLQTSLQASPETDRALAERYCSACHATPLPEHLPQSSWDFVLDWMGNFLGIENREGPLAPLVKADQIPPEPLLKPETLHRIRHYFVRNAPAQIPQPQKPNPRSLQSSFRAEAWRSDELVSFIPMVRIDSNNRRLFVGDAAGKRLLVYSEAGALLEAHRVTSEPIHLEFERDDFYLTLIGDLERDRGRGEIFHYEKKPPDGYQLRRVLGGYFRIAHTVRSDLNGDGVPDFLVAAFGDYDRGRVAWLETREDHYRERILVERAGAVKGAVVDLDGDGREEILVLMAQGRNQLLLFDGKDGDFRQRVLLEKFAGFGYNDLLVGDLNGDGLPDLVTINGNNMEMPEPPLRGYHGVRAYLNRGGFEFEESFFYPMHGAMRGVLTDFDGDGYPDIGVVAYYPDWSAERPETFTLLRNEEGIRFVPYSHPATGGGRWLSIDAGDLNGDGREDLVLGNGLAVTGISASDERRLGSDYGEGPPLLILWNQRTGLRSAEE
ncbi:MAG TPA: VCBS repeat-containing protein [Acidobacteriota bacterium]|nr:VCBS repeat-containing protein [Acidobacteriota bacterium]